MPTVDERAQAYCERDGDGFDLLGEPMNFFSNFLQIGIGLAYSAKVSQEPHLDVNLPGAVLYTLTGVGSAIWHSVALTATYALDMVIPIMFIGWFSFNWAYRVLHLRSVALRITAMLVAYGGMATLAVTYDSPLFGVHWSWISLLLILAVLHYRLCTWRPRALLKAFLIMSMALCCYALDRVACQNERSGYQPGFHWLWHVISAFGGLMLLRSLPPEDWYVEGHDVKDIWCGGCLPDAVSDRAPAIDASTLSALCFKARAHKAACRVVPVTSIENTHECTN